MDEKQIKHLLETIERLLGNPLEADDSEIEALLAEFGEDQNPAQVVFDLAASAARTYRLNGASVPPHVLEAIRSTKALLFGEDIDTANADTIIDTALSPYLGPTTSVSCAFHNRKKHTEKDRELLDRLANEVRKDWREDGKK